MYACCIFQRDSRVENTEQSAVLLTYERDSGEGDVVCVDCGQMKDMCLLQYVRPPGRRNAFRTTISIHQTPGSPLPQKKRLNSSLNHPLFFVSSLSFPTPSIPFLCTSTVLLSSHTMYLLPLPVFFLLPLLPLSSPSSSWWAGSLTWR